MYVVVMTYIWLGRPWIFLYIEVLWYCMSSLGIVQWNSTRRDHTGNPGGVSGSSPVIPSSRLFASSVSRQSTSSLALWHSRLGHASISRVKKLVYRGLLGSVSNKTFDCMTCQFGKQTAFPFNNCVSHALSSFDLIHSDV